MTTRIDPIDRPDWTFLTAGDVPPNVLGLHEGDVIRVLRARGVERVGYRLTRGDLLPEAKTLLRSEEGLRATGAYARALGLRLSEQDLLWVVADALLRKQGFGGRDRGIYVSSRDPLNVFHRVVSTRCVQTGRYYAGSPGSYEDPSDCEPPGLGGRRTVVLVLLDNGAEMISGDLERVLDGRPLIGAFPPGFPVDLMVPVGLFHQDQSRYRKPEWARNYCEVATEDFLVELKRHGFQGERHLFNFRNDRQWAERVPHRWFADGPGQGCLGHVVAQVGPWFIDFTARQFHPDAPFPLIWRQEGSL